MVLIRLSNDENARWSTKINWRLCKDWWRKVIWFCFILKSKASFLTLILFLLITDNKPKKLDQRAKQSILRCCNLEKHSPKKNQIMVLNLKKNLIMAHCRENIIIKTNILLRWRNSWITNLPKSKIKNYFHFIFSQNYHSNL